MKEVKFVNGPLTLGRQTQRNAAGLATCLEQS
jgi:hypothetical protein